MAAAVLVPPSPHDPLSTMATAGRRAPLASIPNATNSPHRILTNSGSKRSRNQANVSQQENEHPPKRIAVDKVENGPITPGRHPAEGRVFERGSGTHGSTAFQKRLVAARDKTGLRVTKNVEPAPKEDSIRQWQKHYRRLFPTFSFYFDGVADAAKATFVKQITSLGAREEKFFSKSVSHIITTRPIPSEDSSQAISISSGQDEQTINPTLLDKTIRQRREAATNHDILQRGRQMNMKIWAAEKLHRILTSIIDDGIKYAAVREPADLSQALRNDKIGVSEREQPSLLRDLVPFKGPYIYIHDMDERYRPTIVRDYKAPARRGEGEWPQFRSAAVGKCPFVEDPGTKREMEQAKKAAQQRAAYKEEATRMQPPRRASPRKALREVDNPPATINPSVLHKRADSNLSFPPMPSQQAMEYVRGPGGSLLMAREPAASGIQRSNITSAIQSNMISSTAATGVKATTSKEVHELKRKVLERTNTGSLSVGSIPSSHRMNDLAGVLKNARAPAPARAAKSKAQEKLGGIQEDDEEEYLSQRAAKASRKRSAQRDPKPGYCENCRDKYEDFEEHILSRKHRKFACTQSNWDELDALLSKLQQP